MLHFAFAAWQSWTELALTKAQHSLTHSPVGAWGIYVRDTVVIFYHLRTD